MQSFSLLSAVAQADLFSRSIALILLAMSVISWSTLVVKSVHLYHLYRLKLKTISVFWAASSYEEAVTTLDKKSNNPFAQLAYTGYMANMHSITHSTALHHQFDMNEWLTRCMNNTIEEQINRLKSGMAILASIGSTAPFIGLLGTVWGIYHALRTIGLTGETSIRQVAGPVGEALIMTAFGLFVAIPAVLGFNFLTRRFHCYINALSVFANDLYALFMTGARLDTHLPVDDIPTIALATHNQTMRKRAN